MMAIALGFLMFQNEFLNLSKKVVIFGTLKAFLILMTSQCILILVLYNLLIIIIIIIIIIMVY